MVSISSSKYKSTNNKRWDSSKNRRMDAARHQRIKEDMETFDFLYGKSVVLAALKSSKRKIDTLMMQDTMFDDYYEYVDNPQYKVSKENRVFFSKLKKLLELDDEIRLGSQSKMKLNEFTANRPHQGVVMKASKLNLEMIQEIPSPTKKNAVWLALDEVVDPQNLGALIRTSNFLEIEGVLMSSKNTAPLSSTVSRASAGSLETMENLYATKNLPKTLKRADEEHGWRILGASLGGPVVTNLREIETNTPTVLVLGNEGKGLRTNVLRACTGGLVRIEGGGGDLDSLNVSVAGGIALHYLINY